MARSPWLAPLAMILVCVMFLTGCMSAAPRRFDDGATVAVGHADGDTSGGAQKTHGGDAFAALLFVGFVFIAAVVVVDVILLPVTIPCHEPFYCTHEVIHCCCH